MKVRSLEGTVLIFEVRNSKFDCNNYRHSFLDKKTTLKFYTIKFQEAAFQTKFEEKPSTFQTKFTDFTSELNSIDLENNQIRPAFSDLLPPKRVKSINHGN